MVRSTGSARRLFAVLALAASVACHRDAPLGPTLTVEDVVQHLDADLGGGERELVDPGDALRGDGARTGLVLAPGAKTSVRVAVPERAALRFGVGVAGDKTRDDSRTGVRFTLTVDGTPLFTRTVNPAGDRRDRRWFDERIDLAAYAGRSVEIALAVEAEAPGKPVAGTAAWSRVRVVQATALERQRRASDRPNVVVLLVDTLRADAVGLYGAGPGASPALDALGARGTVFATAVSQSSWTLPSVASIMTGLPSRRHGAVGEAEHGANHAHARWGFLADHLTTWAEAAAHAGITTFAASANPLVSVGTNLAQGFETVVELPWDPDGHDWASAEEVNGAFLAWLPRREGYRFVAYLHYMEPHDPYTPPAARTAPTGVRPAIASGWVRDAANRINWSGGDKLTADEVAYLRTRYAGEVQAWDRAFGALTTALARAGLDRDTIIVVTADHGEEFQEHGRLTHGSHLYEESIRVPLVLAGPGIPAQRRSDVAQGIDLFPTLARVLGTDVPPHLPGRDLLGAPDERPAIVETASGIGPDGSAVSLVALRTARWKLVQTPRLGRNEVYDLEHDPREQTDRSQAAPEAAALLAALELWRGQAPAAATVAGTSDPGFAAKLRALGYAE
ncbi:MAG TPA: sulfatase [Candidatus Eisenbacteria bacterium]|nr:sulfatase [Candidatus Eisenbacteria bacterium]